MSDDVSLTLTARAKVNLSLGVTGRRADGYHLLDSLVVFTEFGDGLSFAPAENLSLTVTGPFWADIPTGPENLVLKAAEALRTEVGGTRGAAITLNKRIPAAAGIGGGSADAAATLRGLCQLWKVDVNWESLLQLAERLGADVPVCLTERATMMRGVGEDLSPTPSPPPLGMVLVNSGIALSTVKVFRHHQEAFSPPSPPLKETDFTEPEKFVAALRSRHNDLTKSAIALVPEIQMVLDTLKQQPNCLLARMSGSGATCFGLFVSEATARQAAEKLKQDNSRWWVQATRVNA